MKEIPLTKTMKYPQTSEEFKAEHILDKHERYLRCLIINGFKPIYLGDIVKASDRWAGHAKNPNAGKVGMVRCIEAGLQAAFNIDYLVYHVKPADGEVFETYYYALDLAEQSPSNALLEKILRESNENFKSRKD